MIEEQVIVTATTPEGAWVEGIQQSACGSCSAKAGCGQHTMSQLGKKVTLWLPFDSLQQSESGLTEERLKEERLKVGQQVVVGLPEGAILRSTLVLYGVPLLALVAGAILGHAFWGELGSIFMSILFMAVGFKLAGRISDNNKRQWQPQLLRDCSSHKVEFDRSDLIHSSNS